MEKPETTTSFGYWVRRQRLALDLTQADLARRVGCAKITIVKIERDERRPSRQMANLLADHLAISDDQRARFVAAALGEVSVERLSLSNQPLAVPNLLSPALLARPKLNLPIPTTPLIGREQELAELAHLLRDPGTRLVTILSAGGMGKTRLALAAAAQQMQQFANGVCWVPLAPLTAAEEMELAIAAALGLQLQGVHTTEQQIGDFLRTKHLLLVLDNFDHLLAGASLVAKLLAAAPQLSILVTSRQRLKLTSETVFLLDGLRFPRGGLTDALAYPAVELFLLHARRVRRNYQPDEDDMAGIVEICRLVHGMPLGLLLAAAWSNVISPPEIALGIGRELDFLQAELEDVPVRQRRLRAVFLQTWQRLDVAERSVFMCLSVFRGGATAEAVKRVAGATVPALVGLVDKALIWRLPNGRFEIHELLRQFAAEQLAITGTERQAAMQLQHSRYYLDLLSAQEQPLQGQEQRSAIEAIQADFENISVSWRWAVQQHHHHLLAPAVQALFLFCEIRGRYRDGVFLFSEAAARLAVDIEASAASPELLQALLGKVLGRLGACEVALSVFDDGEQHLRTALQLVMQGPDRALALLFLGVAAGARGDLPLARSLLTDSLAICQQCSDTAGMAYALNALNLGVSDYTEASRLTGESLSLWRKVGRPDRIAVALTNLGWFYWCLGNYAGADICQREGMAIREQFESRNEIVWALDGLGLAAWGRGDMTTAEIYFQKGIAIGTEQGIQADVAMCMADLALVLASTGVTERAVSLARQAVAITREVNGQIGLTLSLNNLGAALIAAGDLVEARRTLTEAIQRAWGHGYIYNVMQSFYFLAQLLEVESQRAESLQALEHRALAVALLTCVRSEAATWQIFRDKAAELQAHIGDSQLAETRSAAIELGKSETVEQMVAILLER